MRYFIVTGFICFDNEKIQIPFRSGWISKKYINEKEFLSNLAKEIGENLFSGYKLILNKNFYATIMNIKELPKEDFEEYTR